MTTLAANTTAREDSYDRRNRKRRYKSIHNENSLRSASLANSSNATSSYLVGSNAH